MGLYLDNASTTPVDKRVIDAMMPYFTDKWHNPSSLCTNGTKVRDDVEKARSVVADFINAEPDEIFFTSGASEANNWAIRGFDDAYNCDKDRLLRFESQISSIITTTIEHKSLIEAVSNPMLISNVYFCGVDKFGFVDLDALEAHLCNRSKMAPKLVSIQLANNEIGTIQNIEEISSIVHEYNGILHTDATQAFGKIPIDVEDMWIDMLSASGHKIGAPKGIGILYKRKEVDLMPLICGSQMNGMRGGTENVPYIIGMAKAVEVSDINGVEYGGWSGLNWHMEGKRDKLINDLVNIGCKLNGSLSSRLPNNINIMLPEGISGESMLYVLDMSGVCIAVGSACNSHSISASPVLKAIGLSDEEAARCIRITLSPETTYDDINYVTSEIEKAIKVLSC